MLKKSNKSVLLNIFSFRDCKTTFKYLFDSKKILVNLSLVGYNFTIVVSVLPRGRYIVLSIKKTREPLTKHQQIASTFVWCVARFLPNRKFIYSEERLLVLAPKFKS